MGDGSGNFTPANVIDTGGVIHELTTADLNGDKFADLVYQYRDVPQVGVSLGNGDGTFQTATYYATTSGGFAASVADLNGDGELDILVSGGGSLLLGNGDGTFQSEIPYPGGSAFSVVADDLNGDAYADIATAGAQPHVLQTDWIVS